MAARSSEDDETDRLTVWFGPPSRKRNLWMFVGTTGTVGLILALILLFQTDPPEDAQIAMSKKKAEEKKVVEETPQPDPEPTIVAKIEPEPEPEPEPEITPEPTPPPVEDLFDVQVILLPGPPEKNQGEQFEVTGEEEPIIPDDGFDLVTTHWQESDLLDRESVDPWAELQKLVPLEPFGPSDYVLDPIPGGAVTASFLTTQPRRGTQSLLMPYEMSVTNTGASKIDRVVMEQTLPESIELRETSAVHAAEDRTLRWEYENLSPRQQWRVPMVVVPTLQGQVSLLTTIEVGRVASAKTVVQRPDIELSLTCEPAAQYKKYHQIVFLMKNTGEVPLNNLLMDVQLTGNLWHRFGQDFEFFEEQLDVGQTRRALLHVKTEDLGGANLQASLVTDEGAQAAGQCEFVIVGDGKIEARGVESSPREPSKEEFQQPEPLAEEESRTWRERKGTAKEKPDLSSESSEASFARPNRAPKTLQAAEEAATDRKPPEKEAAPPSKPETVEEFPEFPGFEPLPERKSESEVPESKSEREDAAKDPDSPAEDPFAPMETEEDPFAPSKKENGFFE